MITTERKEILVIVMGEAMSGEFPIDDPRFIKIDSRRPLQSLMGEDVLKRPNAWNLDKYLARIGVGHTYGDIERAVLDHPIYSLDYERIRERVVAVAPGEWAFNPMDPVKDSGSRQRLRYGVLKFLGALAMGMDNDFLVYIKSIGQDQQIALFGGLTGGTGSSGFLTLMPYLQRNGYPNIVPFGALTHVPSIQVNGRVREHVVRRVYQMLQLIPGMVVFTGMPADAHDGKTTWHDLIDMTYRITELDSNALVISENMGTTPHMWALALNRRQSLWDRWMINVLVTSAQLSPDKAVAVLRQYINDGLLDFGKPDSKGFSPIEPRDRTLLKVEHLKVLLPALLVVRDQALRVVGSRRQGLRNKEVRYDVTLKGSTLIDDLLRKAGVTTPDELRVNGLGYAGIAQYEHAAIHAVRMYRVPEAMEYHRQHWVTMVRQYAGKVFGPAIAYTAMEFLMSSGVFYTLTQPLMTTQELTLAALSIIGEVDNPWEREAREAEARAKQEAEEARRQAIREEVHALLSRQEK